MMFDNEEIFPLGLNISPEEALKLFEFLKSFKSDLHSNSDESFFKLGMLIGELSLLSRGMHANKPS